METEEFPLPDVNLDEEDERVRSLEPNGCPPIAFLCVGLDVMRQMLLSMQGDEASCSATIARGAGSHPIGAPASSVEVLEGGLHGLGTHVGFLQEQKMIWLGPDPVLNL